MPKTKYYSLKDIVELYGRPYSTTARHIEELKKKKVKGKPVFVKKTPGYYYSKNEIETLAILLDFDL